MKLYKLILFMVVTLSAPIQANNNYNLLIKACMDCSWITYPENGRIPYSEQGNQERREAYEKFSGYGGPEGAPQAERCLIGLGSTSGPPMNSVLYNNMYQIVQTDDYVMILVEMVHDARIIPINGDHRPEAIEQWMGDSIASVSYTHLTLPTKA